MDYDLKLVALVEARLARMTTRLLILLICLFLIYNDRIFFPFIMQCANEMKAIIFLRSGELLSVSKQNLRDVFQPLEM